MSRDERDSGFGRKIVVEERDVKGEKKTARGSPSRRRRRSRAAVAAAAVAALAASTVWKDVIANG